MNLFHEALAKIKVGVEQKCKDSILKAYDLIEQIDEDLSENDLELQEWDNLVDQANEILFS